MLSPEEQLAFWIEKSQAGPFSEIVEIGPALARVLLTLNAGNRKLRMRGARSVFAYAKAMERGEWRLNSSGLGVSRDGKLMNGQHRLLAVIAYDKPVWMQITFGLDPEAILTEDVGRPRRGADFLHMAGYTDPNNLASAARFVHLYDATPEHPVRGGDELTTQQLEAVVEANPELADALRTVTPLAKQLYLSRGNMAAAYHICARVSEGVAADLLARTTSLIGPEVTKLSPPYVLNRRYLDHATRRGRMHAIEQAAYFIKAFNLMLCGKEAHFLKYTRTDPFPTAGELTEYQRRGRGPADEAEPEENDPE